MQLKKEHFFFWGVWILILSPNMAGTPYSKMFVFPFVLLCMAYFLFFGIEKGGTPFVVPLYAWLCAIFFFGNNLDVGHISQMGRLFLLLMVYYFSYSASKSVNFNGLVRLSRWVLFFLFFCLVFSISSEAFFNFLFSYYYTTAFDESSVGYMLTRPGLTIGNPNELGLVICLFLVVVFHNVNSRWGYGAVLAGIFVLIFTMSRTAMGALFVSTLIVFFLCRKFLPLVGFLVVILVGLISFKIFGGEGFDNLIFRFSDGANLAGRDQIWDHAIAVWSSSTISLYFGSFVLPGNLNVVDSEYFNILVRYGLVGLFSLAILFVFLLLFSLKNFSAKSDSVKISAVHTLLMMPIAFFASAPLSTLKLGLIFTMLYAFYISKSKWSDL